MTLPYGLRLLILSLAAFFVVHLILSAIALALSPVLISRTKTSNAERSADLLLSLRLFPVMFSALFVGCFCIPSFLRWEPDGMIENVGLSCLALAALCTSMWALSALRFFRAWSATRRFLAYSQDAPSAPSIVLAGIFRTRVIVSVHAKRELPARQLAAAIRHEQAHEAHRDNVKRTLCLLTPEPLPGFRLFRSVETAWATRAEWAADDAASCGCEEDAVSLAEALLCVARFGVPSSGALASAFSGGSVEIAVRIERLLSGKRPIQPPRRCCSFPVVMAILLAGAPAVSLTHISVLRALHRSLEMLMH